ncbi:unnamed protein product [Phytophthora fragariaefolia]|uniref:Unnamed protein product n=1 Tax=Phytophthora fragariaefolia TaxID=1490495 RepID=A0A9W7D0Y7_9STRA|nr:unnamed protein product [Phytophthora fragariaefolia]
MAKAEMVGLASPVLKVPYQITLYQSLWKRTRAKWNSGQVENQGAYSIERLESLALYYGTTSRKRVVLVCVLSPIPAILVAVLLKCLPLRPPSEGWSANWVFWLRLFMGMTTVGIMVNSQLLRLIPGLEFTTHRSILVSVGTITAFEATYFLASSQIGFPVPFMMQFGALVLLPYSTLMTWLVLGSALFAKVSPLKIYADRYFQFFGPFMMLCGAFPMYKVLYELIPVKYRDVAVVILPLWKFGAKRFIVSNTRKLEDVMPLLVALSVDFFCSLFVAVCMSTSKSISFTLLVIAVNISQSLLEIRAMRANGRVLLRLLDERRNSQTWIRRKIDLSGSPNILTIILDATQTCASLPPKSLEQVRLWAYLPYSLTKDKLERLRTLDESGVYRQKDPFIIDDQQRQQVNLRRREFKRIRIAPISPIAGPSGETTRMSSQPATDYEQRYSQRSKNIVIQGVNILFHAEYVTLVVYVESIVPIAFVVFKSILEHLPNVAYYPGGAGTWNMDSVLNVSFFAVLEIGLLLACSTFLRYKSGFSPLYQLAFVLETEVWVVQSGFFSFFLVVLQYELEHFG